jgi:hypothetical protein
MNPNAQFHTSALRSSSLSLSPQVDERRGSMYQPPSRRGSEAMLSDGLPSPPISPGHSDEEGVQNIIIDAEPRYSGPERNLPPHVHEPLRQHRSSSDESTRVLSQPIHRPTPIRKYSRDIDAEMQTEDRPAPKPPLRYLHDEQSHLSKPGVLKLTDFVVRGTLGTFSFLLGWEPGTHRPQVPAPSEGCS